MCIRAYVYMCICAYVNHRRVYGRAVEDFNSEPDGPSSCSETAAAFWLIASNRWFVIKPERVSNLISMYFWINQWGSMKTWGLQKHQRGLTPNLPYKSSTADSYGRSSTNVYMYLFTNQWHYNGTSSSICWGLGVSLNPPPLLSALMTGGLDQESFLWLWTRKGRYAILKYVLQNMVTL